MMNNKVYQEIYNELDKYLLNGWDRLVIYLEYGKASYSFSFFIKANNEYIKCYDLPDVSEDELENSFKKIDSLIFEERKKDKNLWTNMTMVVDSNGKMKTDFDYTDLSAGTYQFKKEWKKRYLV